MALPFHVIKKAIDLFTGLYHKTFNIFIFFHTTLYTKKAPFGALGFSNNCNVLMQYLFQKIVFLNDFTIKFSKIGLLLFIERTFFIRLKEEARLMLGLGGHKDKICKL